MLANSKQKIWTEPVTGMEFVWVSGGCFQMGLPVEEKDYLLEAYKEYYSTNVWENEMPRHEVCVDGFWMGKFEVTRGQFRKFIKATGYRTDAEKKGKAFTSDVEDKWKRKELDGLYWDNVGFSQTDAHPVLTTSWNDAQAMANWMSSKSDKRFRLPTEAEWEYGSRAGSTAIRYWGTTLNETCDYANIADENFVRKGKVNWTIHACDDGYTFTSPVGSFRPNDYGIYDSLGNAWEWCNDWYDDTYYSQSPKQNPQGPSVGAKHAFRGGAWGSSPEYVRAADRRGNVSDYRHTGIGFRLVYVD